MTGVILSSAAQQQQSAHFRVPGLNSHPEDQGSFSIRDLDAGADEAGFAHDDFSADKSGLLAWTSVARTQGGITPDDGARFGAGRHGTSDSASGSAGSGRDATGC